jgi:two-component system, NarL family, invasion response regulator UvrY
MKILIVDDHAVVRQGVQRLLSTLPNAVVYEAATSHEALACARNQHPDVENSSVRVLMFSMHAEAIYANRALQAGAYGYVCKSAGADELTTGVLRVFQGERYLDSTLAGELAMSAVRAEDPMRNLTNREIEILRMLGEGKSLQGIADAIGIAYKTVANSCGRIKEKLDLPRTSDLIRFSIENRRN